jgi:hypothetical protein
VTLAVAFGIASTPCDLLTLHCMAFQLWAKPVFFSSRTVYNDVLPLRVDVRSDKPLEACTSPFFLFLVLSISNSKNPQVCITLILHTPHLLRSASNLPVALSINNNLGASKQALAELLLCSAGVQAALPLGSPPPLLDQSVAGLAEVAHLVVLHALEPVAEAGADEAVDGVGEEALAVEEGAHLDAELP